MAAEPAEWLERMSHAHRELSYQGIVTHQVDDQLASYRIVHRVVDGREFELLTPLDSSSTKLVRRGHSIHCVHPAESMLRAISGSGGFARYYDLRLEEGARVAGRDVVTLHIEPRDVFRLGYVISLDAQTAIPLKTETLGQRDQVLERFQFMLFELGVGGELNDAEAYEIGHREVVEEQKRKAMLSKLSWNTGWVPDGFMLAETTDRKNEALSYTDGISMFSVFMERASDAGQSPAAAAMRSGATVSYTYPIPERELVATVIGEVPLLTAEQVAKSLVVNP
nr:MucB/RseB C-terminal domain-containing protein [Litorivivens lipolytica]